MSNIAIYEIPISYDVLHAAVLRCLKKFSRGFVDFSDQVVSPNSESLIKLSQPELGEVGEIRISKLADDVSEIGFKKHHIFSPAQFHKMLEETSEEYRNAEPLEKVQLADDKKDECNKQIEIHLNRIVKGLFYRLANERIWQHSGTVPPLYLLAIAGEEIPYERLIDRASLIMVAQGKWKDEFDTLEASLEAFSGKLQDKPFGRHKFKFLILENKAYSKPASKCWMVAKYEYNRETLFTVELGDGTLAPEGNWPYAEVIARKIPDGLIIHFCYLSNHIDAIDPYIKKLISHLAIEGLDIIEQSTEDFLVDEEMRPWDRIPDQGWDRKAVELWHKGLTAPEIAQKVGVVPRRVTNRLSELRVKYSSEIVPYKKDIIRKLAENS